MKANNGDLPASPTIYADMAPNGQREIYCANAGLTKREMFAMAAMQGLLASDTCGNLAVNRCAELSVQHADALLAELEK